MQFYHCSRCKTYLDVESCLLLLGLCQARSSLLMFGAGTSLITVTGVGLSSLQDPCMCLTPENASLLLWLGPKHPLLSTLHLVPCHCNNGTTNPCSSLSLLLGVVVNLLRLKCAGHGAAMWFEAVLAGLCLYVDRWLHYRGDLDSKSVVRCN